MKKLYLIIAAIFMAVMFCSCSKDDSEDGDKTSPDNPKTVIQTWKKLQGKVYGWQSFSGINYGYHEYDTLKYCIKDETYIMTWESHHIWNMDYHSNSDTTLYRYTLDFPVLYIEKNGAKKFTFSTDTLSFTDASKNKFELLKYR